MKQYFKDKIKMLVFFLLKNKQSLLMKLSYGVFFNNWKREIIKKQTEIKKFETKEILFQYINNMNDGPIDYLEFGVWQGRTINYWLNLNLHKESRFFGFDTFTGLPETWCYFGDDSSMILEKGKFDVNGNLPLIKDERVTFVKGLFQDTLTLFLNDFVTANRLIINCDSDLYSSCLYVLTKLDKIIKPGTILLFDEFNFYFSEFKAFSEYLESHYRKVICLGKTRDYYQAAFEIVS